MSAANNSWPGLSVLEQKERNEYNDNLKSEFDFHVREVFQGHDPTTWLGRATNIQYRMHFFFFPQTEPTSEYNEEWNVNEAIVQRHKLRRRLVIGFHISK